MAPTPYARMDGAVADLQEISRGLHPAILAKGGLSPALTTLARRSAIPVGARDAHRPPAAENASK